MIANMTTKGANWISMSGDPKAVAPRHEGSPKQLVDRNDHDRHRQHGPAECAHVLFLNRHGDVRTHTRQRVRKIPRAVARRARTANVAYLGNRRSPRRRGTARAVGHCDRSMGVWTGTRKVTGPSDVERAHEDHRSCAGEAAVGESCRLPGVYLRVRSSQKADRSHPRRRKARSGECLSRIYSKRR